MSERRGSGVAAFDFDGTLTLGDTLLPFLRRLCGTPRVVRALVRRAGALADRDAYKAAVLGQLLAGRPVVEIEQLAITYAEAVVQEQLNPATLARVEWHKVEGHQLVIVSASPELYVTPIAARLGFDAVLATRLEVVDGTLTGRLDGPNVRGPEKVRRLRAHLGADPITLWAYGDSSGDRELLASADVATRVTRRGLVPAGGGR